jgi:predicted ATPase
LTDFKFQNLNLLVGANGSGKSNLISFFRLLNAFMDGHLNGYVEDQGGMSDLLFNGRKVTNSMWFETRFGDLGHRFTLKAGPNDSPIVDGESRYSRDGGWWGIKIPAEGKSSLAAHLDGGYPTAFLSHPAVAAIRGWQIYHFHDTSSTAGMRHYEIVQDDRELRLDAANLAPYLRHLRDCHPSSYRDIVNAVRLVTPFFENFMLEPRKMGEAEKVNLSWRQKGSDYPMQPYHLSDGSIRFIALATALLQPEPPSTIIIDEPELGLHPHALSILAELIQDASKRTQLIVATQSATLLDHFSLSDIVVVRRKDGASTFERLDEADYQQWLESYTVGELWVKNVIEGGPSFE